MLDMPPNSRPTLLARGLRRFRQLGAAGPLTILVTVLPTVGGLVLAGFITTIAPWLREHVLLGWTLHCVVFAIAGGFALVPTYVNTGLGGWTFGFVAGFFVVLISLTAAAILTYVLARRAAGSRVAQLIATHPNAAVVYDALIGRSFARAVCIVTLIRIPPGLPYAATNVLMAAARVPLAAYALGTLLGMIPRTLVGTFLFSRLTKLDFSSRHEMEYFAIEILGTGLMLAILSYLARRALAQVK
jgi:uncharacterized membrane protein YdjX (TVP38/TMEM64 family)